MDKRITVSEKAYRKMTADYGPDPCDLCGMDSASRQLCPGCGYKKEWNARFDGLSDDEKLLAKAYNQYWQEKRHLELLEAQVEASKLKMAMISKEFESSVSIKNPWNARNGKEDTE